MRILFTGEGSSDAGIAVHIERIVEECGAIPVITAPPNDLLPKHKAGLPGRLEAIRLIGGEYDVIVVHRDADNAGREQRVAEIEAAVAHVFPASACVPVIPVRMTEAWLILDEPLIRTVAGNPRGTTTLNLPKPANAERDADPKARLWQILTAAADVKGRRLKQFSQGISELRRQLLERTDPYGPVSELSSWKSFDSDLRAAIERLGIRSN